MYLVSLPLSTVMDVIFIWVNDLFDQDFKKKVVLVVVMWLLPILNMMNGHQNAILDTMATVAPCICKLFFWYLSVIYFEGQEMIWMLKSMFFLVIFQDDVAFIRFKYLRNQSSRFFLALIGIVLGHFCLYLKIKEMKPNFDFFYSYLQVTHWVVFIFFNLILTLNQDNYLDQNVNEAREKVERDLKIKQHVYQIMDGLSVGVIEILLNDQTSN